MFVLDIHGVKPNEKGVLESFSSSEEFASEKVTLKSALAAFNEATDGGYRCEISVRGWFDLRTYEKESV